jgi:NAD(P)-dependent dehydrogenase (short-subunit alcohol dehydrogenase family)
MKRALVTGAGGRIGREIAIYLASRGYDIAVHYASSEAGALETVDLIKAQGGHAVSVQADLLDEAQSQQLVARSVDGLGGNLTCLV